MSIYELPDGFQGMETCPANTRVNYCTETGHFGNNYPPFGTHAIGWAPIVPPKKKRRFVVEWCVVRGCWVVQYNPQKHVVAAVLYGLDKNTPEQRESAQAVADIYEPAYEVTP